MKFSAVKAAFSHSSSKEAAGALPRHSSGFDQFHAMLKTTQNLSILDMSGASQANITFITEAGHRVSSDDVMGTMIQIFGTDFFENQQSASTAQRFLEQTLTFPESTFDGVLVWDALQFLSTPLIDSTVTQILRVLRPGGLLLAFFNANEKIKEIPLYNYRIQDSKTLLQIPRAAPQKVHMFNNRMIERLFEKAASVKFFLTRDNLREVLVRR